MKHYLFLLALPLLLATCKKDTDAVLSDSLAGQWSLAAQRDSTGTWQPLIPLVPVIIEFRRDGSFDYLDTKGQPQRNCCQPTQYSFSKFVCPPNAICLPTVGTLTFANPVVCPFAICAATSTAWSVFDLTDTYLDIYSDGSNRSASGLRFQRIK